MQGLLEAADPSDVAISSVIQVRPFPDVFAYGSWGQLITGSAGPGGPAEAEGCVGGSHGSHMGTVRPPRTARVAGPADLIRSR